MQDIPAYFETQKGRLVIDVLVGPTAESSGYPQKDIRNEGLGLLPLYYTIIEVEILWEKPTFIHWHKIKELATADFREGLAYWIGVKNHGRCKGSWTSSRRNCRRHDCSYYNISTIIQIKHWLALLTLCCRSSFLNEISKFLQSLDALLSGRDVCLMKFENMQSPVPGGFTWILIKFYSEIRT